MIFFLLLLVLLASLCPIPVTTTHREVERPDVRTVADEMVETGEGGGALDTCLTLILMVTEIPVY